MVNKYIKSFIERFSNIYFEILRFLLAGGFSFVIDYSVLYILTEIFDVNYLISAGISFSLATIVNYGLCVRYVFKNAGDVGRKGRIVFIGSSVAGLGLNQICMYFFVTIMGVYYMFAKFGATAVVTIWNYIMKKKAIKKEV
ncbi:GtrA family protein [Pectinatus haikarae]|uniref:GtrA family protein n=1 Tax=Pectinatus haikarae TaxID=349096 RepID=UPI0018C4D9A9|nr:GtrA family protein [Pectinatus haikarae]